MERFSFSRETHINNFLNEKFLTILRIANDHPNIYSRNLLEILKENGIEIKKSQFYRYIDCLEEYNLLYINSWTITTEGAGYTYNITEEGIILLDFLSEYFE